MKTVEKDIWQILEESWPSPIISRAQLGKFTGGMIAPGTARNLDSAGEGIKRRFKIGRKTGYLVKDVVEFLRERSEAAG